MELKETDGRIDTQEKLESVKREYRLVTGTLFRPTGTSVWTWVTLAFLVVNVIITVWTRK